MIHDEDEDRYRVVIAGEEGDQETLLGQDNSADGGAAETQTETKAHPSRLVNAPSRSLILLLTSYPLSIYPNPPINPPPLSTPATRSP